MQKNLHLLLLKLSLPRNLLSKRLLLARSPSLSLQRKIKLRIRNRRKPNRHSLTRKKCQRQLPKLINLNMSKRYLKNLLLNQSLKARRMYQLSQLKEHSQRETEVHLKKSRKKLLHQLNKKIKLKSQLRIQYLPLLLDIQGRQSQDRQNQSR